MSILDLLGLKRGARRPEAGDTETVRKIVRELDALQPERARYLAAFAYLLSRAANADLEISDEETRKMERLLQDTGHLPEEQAVLAVQIAKSQSRLFGGTENFLVAREFKEIATREQCEELLHCLFAVSAADDSISSAEEAQIRQVASELGFSLAEYTAIRAGYNDKRDVLKQMRRPD
ncbi:MAG TPA: TerB family tellurite resistance protein [Thermoanaerobaculia bacterium]|nr:TerB family tellurite resistance protein [Thermoanaerobaculia bacterium]